MNNTSVAQRVEIAAAIGINPDYLYQIFTGRKLPSPELSLSIERQTSGRISREALRPNDFWRIWPDLQEPKKKQATALANSARVATKKEEIEVRV